MKFQGKTSKWFKASIVVVNAVFIYLLFFGEEATGELAVCALIFNLICIPIVIRNYVTVDDHRVTVFFGFITDSMELEDIVEVRLTFDIIATTAASLDRIAIKGKRNELLCSVKDKKGFFLELRRRNPKIRFL